MKNLTIVFFLLIIGFASISQTLVKKGKLAQDGDFKIRVKIAMVTAARANATATEKQFLDYEKIHNYAVQLLNEPDSKLSAFCFGVAADPAILKEATDSNIQSAVDALFSIMAGVRPSDATKTTVAAAATLEPK